MSLRSARPTYRAPVRAAARVADNNPATPSIMPASVGVQNVPVARKPVDCAPLGLVRLKWLVFLFAALTANAAVCADDPDALWRIVHEHCVRNMVQFGTPLPCAAVNESGGYAIMKDRNGASQFLLLATARVSGIDDPAVLDPAAPNYWRAAWEATPLVEAMVGRALPRDALSLAINSVRDRTQNQLHIHIDCVSPLVRATLREHSAEVGEAWAPLPVPLAGHYYRAMRVRTLTQSGATPFRLVARLADARVDMAGESLAVVGAVFPDGEAGFYLLESRSGRAVDLQDRGCAVASSP